MQCDRFNHWTRYLLFILFTMLAGCFSSGDGEAPVSDTPLTGVLLDGPVSGVSYSSGTQTGTTNAAGEFKYFPGETIVFSIGGIKLGQVTLLRPVSNTASVFVTPVELTGSLDASDPKVIRLLQFLQSLDSDGDHSNGITITAATVAAAASIVLDFSDPDFEFNNPSFNLQTAVDGISDPNDPVPAIVSAAEALQNFSTTIQDNGLTISLTPTFQLVWSDEFNEATLNTEDWNFETGYGPPTNVDGWGNDEWQLYTQNSENLGIVFEDQSDPFNGYLKISAQCVAPGVDNVDCRKRDDSITSAKINTKDKQEFQFGRIEARIKVPTGKGAWPAFWSLGAGYPETPWPAAGEIDFMEVFSVNNDTTKDGLFTIHWEDPEGSGTRQFTTTAKPFDGSSFHIFEAEWSNDRIIGKIDRVEFANYPLDPATQSELLNPFYLILNVAMGGNPVAGLEPDATTPWPQEMLVDYIRVYQAVAGLNNDVVNINFEGGPSVFVCLEDGSGCGGPTGFAGGDASVQPNPSTVGNASANAVRFQKFDPGNGEAFGGTLVRLTDNALDFAASNNIFTVKVYSTRSVPVRLELGDDNPNDGSPGVEVVHSGSGWEELTFDVSGVVSQVTRFNQIVFIFDNGTVGDADGDPANWTFYFDDIVLQKLPPVTGGGLGATDGDFGDGSSDGTGFGIFSETNTTSAATNTNIVSAGNTVVIDGASTAVTPFDGSAVLALTYSDNTESNGFGGAVFQFDSADVSAFTTLKFTIDAASFTNLANLTVQIEPPGGGTAGGNVALADYTPVAVLGNWKTYEIPLADFTAVNPASISALGFFNARDGSDALVAGTLYLDDIHFTGVTGGTGSVALPFSDDFESGDLAGWTAVPNGGTITADDTQAGGGTFSARLVAGTAQAPALSIEGLAAGSVSPNDNIDVSWDMCGSFAGAGEVMFPALISERGDGSGGERVFDTIATMPAVWTRFTRSFAADANAANLVGGVSVQFDVVCGGDAGCAADVFIDNVAITNGGGDPGGPASGASCATVGGGGGTATELLTNGTFDAGKDPWINAGVVINEAGNNVYQADVAVAGNPFDVNLSQVLELTPSETYTLTFRARASVARSMLAGIGLNEAPFSNVTEAVPLTTEFQTFTYVLTAPGDVNANSRVLFDMGAEVGTVFIDDVSLTVGSLLTNGSFEASATDKAPWINAGVIADDAGNNVYQADVAVAGNPFDVNLSQVLELTPNESYVLTFKARASVTRTMLAGIGLNEAPFSNVTEVVPLTTSFQTFTYVLTAPSDLNANSRVLFDMGAEVGTVFIDDVALAVAPAAPVLGSLELLTNGSFEASGTDKAPWINAGVVADDAGNNVYQADVAVAGNPFDVNLSQVLELTPNETYTLQFKARASVARSMLAGIGLNEAPFTNVAEVVPLTTTFQTFTYVLTAPGDVNANSRVLFDMGAEVGTVFIDDVSLTVGSLLTNGSFEASATDKAPWINAGVIADDAGNNVYQADVAVAGNPFDVNLSQVLELTPNESYVLTFKARASVTRTMLAGIGLNEAPFSNVTEVVPLTTSFQTFTYVLTAPSDLNANSRVLFDMGAEVGTVFIDDVALAIAIPAPTGGGGGAGGNLAVNGDFETGDFTGWEQFVNSGAQSISTDTPDTSTSSAAVSGNTAPGTGGTSEIKQTERGIGDLALGDIVRIQFDVKGTFGPGGQMNVLSFTEQTVGATQNNNTIVDAAFTGGTAIGNGWFSYDYTVTLAGSDIGRGFSLAFNPVCGAVAGCVADVLIDNVSIVKQ